MRIPKALFGLTKEVLRHLLRRPVVGFVVCATTSDGHVVLIRRGDTGEWALPGGTLEWDETFTQGLPRELLEEAGVSLTSKPVLAGVYSDPGRDPRFHAVTTVFRATVGQPERAPMNPLEILEVKTFAPDALPAQLSHGNADMLRHALAGESFWE